MPERRLSKEVRKLIEAGGPPYDAQKVMTWFNENADAALLEIEFLEEDHDTVHAKVLEPKDFSRVEEMICRLLNLLSDAERVQMFNTISRMYCLQCGAAPRSACSCSETDK